MSPSGLSDVRSTEPFPGPRYFEAHDAEFFFGRDEDVERILPIVLSSRATLLHARSGAGKTSLLNVLVTPRLEAHGVRPIRVRLWDDPQLSTREAVMRSGLPHPQLEANRVELACRHLSVSDDASLETLGARRLALGEDRSGEDQCTGEQ